MKTAALLPILKLTIGIALFLFFSADFSYGQKDKYGNVIYKSTSKTVYKDTAGNKMRQTRSFGVKSIEDSVKYVIQEMQLTPLNENQKMRLRGEMLENLLGKDAPAFRLADLEGKEYDNESLKGKIAVVNFWFLGCAPCRKEIPDLNRIKKRFENRDDIVFLAIALDNAEKIKKFISENEFLYAHIPDGKDAAVAFGISAYPANLIIDRDGKLAFVRSAYYNDNEKRITKAIEKLLK
jgi:peroxiredoxin